MAVSGAKKLRLGEILINANVLQPDQLEDALEKQKESREPIGEILTKMGFVTEEKIKYALELQYGVKHVNLKNTRIAPEVLKLLPEALMRQFQMIPVAVNQITVALVDPNNILATDEIRKRLRGVNVVPAVCTESDFWETLKAIPKEAPANSGGDPLRMSLSNVSLKDLLEVQVSSDSQLKELIDKASKGGESALVPLVNAILSLALKKRASRVFLESMEHEVVLRFRVDGHMLRETAIPGKLGGAIVSRVKIMAGLAQTGGNAPQSGTFAFSYEGRAIKIAFHSMPSRHGQLLTMRLFDSATLQNQQLDNLVLHPRTLAAVRAILAKPAGVMLFAGPHGAGKTILMYACLMELQARDATIITVESPIEFELAGVTQVSVSSEPGPNDLSVPAGLRSALDQSPDVVMLGDVSDPAIAQRLVRGGLSGTLLMAGMSTTQSPLIEARETWEVPSRMVANAVAGLVTQRLVRRLCPQCKEKYRPEDERMVAFFARLNGSGELHRPIGCETCFQTGFSGQVGVYEVIPFTPQIRELVARNAPKGHIDQLARQAGYMTLEDYGMWLVGQGYTTWDEIKKTDILELAQSGQMASEAAGSVPASGSAAAV